MWRLTRSRSNWAVKEPFEQPSVVEADDDDAAAFQEAVRATGVPDRRRPMGRPGASTRCCRCAYRDRPGGSTRRVGRAGGVAGASADLQTCHRDLFADNVLRTPAGSLCVIDWENSGLADPTQELGLVLFEYSCGRADRARDLYRAYRRAGGPGFIERPGNFSMVVAQIAQIGQIAQIAHIGEISCSRWLDPARLAERDRNTGRIDEFVTEMITRRMIDELGRCRLRLRSRAPRRARCRPCPAAPPSPPDDPRR